MLNVLQNGNSKIKRMVKRRLVIKLINILTIFVYESIFPIARFQNNEIASKLGYACFKILTHFPTIFRTKTEKISIRYGIINSVYYAQMHRRSFLFQNLNLLHWQRSLCLKVIYPRRNKEVANVPFQICSYGVIATIYFGALATVS